MMVRASLLQARLLMRIWVDGRQSTPHISGSNPTFDAAIRHGWVADTGITHTFPNGEIAPTYHITNGGLLAAAKAILKEIDAP